MSGSLRSQALEVAEAIVEDTAAFPLGKTPGLIAGHTGYALFYEAAARSLAPKWLDHAARSLQRAAALFTRRARPPLSLHEGLAGVGWAASHLAARHPALEVEELCVWVDESLDVEMNRSPWPHPCDIRDGLAGMGLYAAKRMPHPSGRRLLERAVARAHEAAERSALGATWPMPPSRWSLYGADATFPQGLYTMGLAHGIPGALCLLSLAHAHGVSREHTRPLLEEGFRWVANHAAPGHPRFPHYLNGAEPVTDTRFSWCVGNPGITAALWWAAHTWKDAAWEARTLDWATRVALEALERAPSHPSANLCCGTAGTAHVFLRLYQATGQSVFGEAARRWIEHTLALRRPGVGPGGYCHEQDPNAPVTDVQFGAAGIALMLMAAATDQPPDWDETFLFSLDSPPTPPEV
ncbi:lanthionine synthetase C family protein [Archangium primigenium]|uniref:lanthionine synthetase C family protein n=1 Tax=[Archangium] primigenium TaxID=2792470 RepID=UPI0019573A24|nr:lanthionine synthetase C family protein [Archangium primigenium]